VSSIKHRLIRDSGCQAFNCQYDDSEHFWLSFLGPDHMSGVVFVRIEPEDFLSLWHGELKMVDIFNMYSQQSPSQIESDRLAIQYKLREATAVHKLPPVIEKPYAKSEH